MLGPECIVDLSFSKFDFLINVSLNLYYIMEIPIDGMIQVTSSGDEPFLFFAFSLLPSLQI